MKTLEKIKKYLNDNYDDEAVVEYDKAFDCFVVHMKVYVGTRAKKVDLVLHRNYMQTKIKQKLEENIKTALRKRYIVLKKQEVSHG